MTSPSDASAFGFDRQTGLATIHEFMALDREVDARCRSNGDAYGIVLVDIEGLRGINAAHGFDLGDDVLVQIARQLASPLRRNHRSASRVSVATSSPSSSSASTRR